MTDHEFPVGKHTGKRLSEIPEDYLRWFLKTDVMHTRPWLWRGILERLNMTEAEYEQKYPWQYYSKPQRWRP